MFAQLVPTDWTGDSDIDTYEETSIVYSGNSSCKVVVNSGTQGNCDLGSNVELEVTAGNTFTFSFWANTSEHVRISGVLDWGEGSEPYTNVYVGPATGGWEQFTFSDVVPAGESVVTVRLRFYDVSGFAAPETQYVDKVEFESPTGTALEVANGSFEQWPSASAIVTAYSISDTEMDVEYGISMTTVAASNYSLTGTSSITFTTAEIDVDDDRIVHLSGASTSMTGDNTLDNIDDAANATNFDFYAGIMPIYFTNTTNPSGIIENSYPATYQGIISANDAYNNLWMSDDAGAYNGVLVFDGVLTGTLNVGDEVLLTASRDIYQNLTELVNVNLLSTISTGNSPYGPSVIDGSDIDEDLDADTNPAESWEGQLVKIENFTVDSYVDFNYRCSWTDGSTTYYFNIGDNVDYQLGTVSLDVGVNYSSITGVVDWYNGSSFYRINPRNQDDIIAGSSSTATQLDITNINGGDPVYDGQSFSVTVQSQDADGVPTNVDVDVDVTLTIGTGTGTLGGVLTGTILSGTNTLTISGVTYTPFGTGVILNISDDTGGLTAGNSNAFDVLEVLPSATQLDITSINGGDPVYEGLPFSVTIQSQDDDGTAANVDIDVDIILTGTGTGTLGGVLTGTILSGTNALTISGVTYTPFETGVILTISDDAGDLTAGNSDAFDVLELLAPTNLEAVVGSLDDVQLTWDSPIANKYSQRSVNAELLGYNVYRDDVQINAAIVEVTEYNDAEPTIGSHDYFVTAVYVGGESDPSNIVSIVVTDINDVTSTSVAIYPNPNNGIFTIEFAAEKTVDVVIMDIAGKAVYSNTLEGSLQINVLGLQQGLYFVSLLDKSTNELIVNKLIIK